MLFLEYEAYKRQYINAQKQLNDVIEEKETLFAKTQPKSTQYDQERVTTTNQNNVMDQYLIEKERKRIDRRLRDARTLIEARADVLRFIERDLRASKEIKDIIYCCRYLDRLKIRKIHKITNYSESQIYRILDSIKKDINQLGV